MGHTKNHATSRVTQTVTQLLGTHKKMQLHRTTKKSGNLSGHKKIMQPLGTKNTTISFDKKNYAISEDKKKQATSRDKKNHATSWGKKISRNLLGQKEMHSLGTKKMTQPLGKKITLPFGTTKKSCNLTGHKNNTTSWDKKISVRINFFIVTFCDPSFYSYISNYYQLQAGLLYIILMSYITFTNKIYPPKHKIYSISTPTCPTI